MKYTVGMTRLALVYTEVDVEAQTPEEAAKKALKLAKSNGNWDVDDLYNDGDLHCNISVSNVVDEEGNEFSVDAECAP